MHAYTHTHTHTHTHTCISFYVDSTQIQCSMLRSIQWNLCNMDTNACYHEDCSNVVGCDYMH